MRTTGLIVDLFAGGGGVSEGVKWAVGRCPDVAINHDAYALEMHSKNHPDTKHFLEDVWDVELSHVLRGRRVSWLHASPDCTHFSVARGSRPVSAKVRSLAWVVCKWAREVRPRVISLENVSEFASWCPLVRGYVCSSCDWRGTQSLLAAGGRCPSCAGKSVSWPGIYVPDFTRKSESFERWVLYLKSLGYKVEWRELNSADFGAATSRKRFYLIARSDGLPIKWPKPGYSRDGSGGRKRWTSLASQIDWSISVPSIFNRSAMRQTKGRKYSELVEATLIRIGKGISRYVLEPGNRYRSPCVRVSTGRRGANNTRLAISYLSKYCGVDVSTLDGLVAGLPTGSGGSVTYGFITKYFGTAVGFDCREPMHTLTSKARFGLVVLKLSGKGFSRVDIGMRMLTPRELANCHGFPASYWLPSSNVRAISAIGNSVTPAVVEAIMVANSAKSLVSG